jgi:hypothetical protein
MPRESAFGVDHYKPKSKAPELECEYSNLYYACNACNGRKKDFWPDAAQLAQGIYIPNPCDDVMYKHLRYEAESVVSRSDAGRFTIDLLQLNDENSVQYRQMLVRAIRRIQDELKTLQSLLGKIDRALLDSTDNPQRIQKLWDRQADISADIDQAKKDIAILMGL